MAGSYSRKRPLWVISRLSESIARMAGSYRVKCPLWVRSCHSSVKHAVGCLRPEAVVDHKPFSIPLAYRPAGDSLGLLQSRPMRSDCRNIVVFGKSRPTGPVERIDWRCEFSCHLSYLRMPVTFAGYRLPTFAEDRLFPATRRQEVPLFVSVFGPNCRAQNCPTKLASWAAGST